MMELISVEFSLEESGTLCHMLTAEIVRLKTQKPPAETDRIARALFTAHVRAITGAYSKLSTANDKLMGKI